METSLIQTIKRWMELEKEIHVLTKKIKELKENKKNVSVELSVIMKKTIWTASTSPAVKFVILNIK